MGKIPVWTKQHRNILDILAEEGRHIAKKEYIVAKMEDISPFYLDVYNWFAGAASRILPKPADVRYPIWVSLSPDSALENDPDTVLLELEVEEDRVIEVDYEKWGYIVNYMYIPDGPEDLRAHQKLLENYGIDDPQAYMTSYYPAIKKKIIKSWDRLFDQNKLVNDGIRMGTLWEIRSEWIKKITR